MAQQCGEHGQRIELCDAFGRLAVAQDESVDGGPFEKVAAETGDEGELDEDEVVCAGPALDLRMQLRQAATESGELPLGLFDARGGWGQGLVKDDIAVQQVGQAFW